MTCSDKFESFAAKCCVVHCIGARGVLTWTSLVSSTMLLSVSDDELTKQTVWSGKSSHLGKELPYSYHLSLLIGIVSGEHVT